MEEGTSGRDKTSDLTDLVDRLRDKDFRVDTRQYLLAHDLLLSLARRGEPTFDASPDKLASYLGPIFSTSEDEQLRFAAIVREWRGEKRPDAPRRTPVSDIVRQNWARTFAQWRRWRRPLWLVLVAVPLLLILAAYRAYYYLPVAHTIEVRERRPSGDVALARSAVVQVDNMPHAVDQYGRLSIGVARARTVQLEITSNGYQALTLAVSGSDPSPVTVTLETAAPQDPEFVQSDVRTARIFGVVLPISIGGRTTHWAGVAWGAIIAGLLVWTVLWLVDRSRRRLAVRRLPVTDDPELITLKVDPPATAIVNEQEARRAAISLRRARTETDVVLHVAGTVNASARNGGFFTPNVVPRRSAPEYVLLVNRRGKEDHQARVTAGILDVFRAHNVALDIYWFRDDPRTCFDDAGTPHRLGHIVNRHHRATLVVCAETAIAFNLSTGRLLGWVEATTTLATRVYVTPEPPYRWAAAEFALIDAGYVVLPATEAGWQQLGQLDGFDDRTAIASAYARGFPAVLAGSDRRWLDRNTPPIDVLRALLRQIETYLGEEGFAWLCACAVYPQISWPLTLAVARSPVDYRLLPALARLPWLRHAFMPDWLRKELVERLPPDEETRVRETLRVLIDRTAPEKPGSAGGVASILSLSALVGPVDVLLAAPSESPLNDAILVGFMAGTRSDPLTFDAPRSILRRFSKRVGEIRAPGDRPRHGWRNFLASLRAWTTFRRSLIRGAVASAVALVAALALTNMLTIARVTDDREPIWFVEIPGGESTAGGAASGSDAARVNVPTFFISRTEVTVGQYLACVREGACKPGDSQITTGPTDFPVRRISWDEAREYCVWLEKRLKEWTDTPREISDALAGRRGTASRVTLPTGPEWLLAARGDDDRRYPWGNQIQPYLANFAATGLDAPSPVGAYPAGQSPFGVLDMSGNVREWTTSSPQGFLEIRGGSFRDPPESLAVTEALLLRSRSERSDDLGFRVVVSSGELNAVTKPDVRVMAPLTLTAQANAPLNWFTKPPTGTLNVGNVPFALLRGPQNVIALNATLNDRAPARVDIGVVERGLRAVHVLLVGAWVQDIERGQRVGRIRLIFDKGDASYDLIAGLNLRESWEYRDSITALGPDSVPGTRWQNALQENQARDRDGKGSVPAVAYLDMLSLQAPANRANDTLRQIVLEDVAKEINTGKGRAPSNPSFSVVAITVESARPPAAAR